jgi:hypothetical protein
VRPNKLHIIASCTLSKTIPPTESQRLGSSAAKNWRPVAKRWRDRAFYSNKLIPARRLYKGLHWQLVLRCEEAAIAAGLDTEVWIVSAGQGLIHADDMVSSYSATFTSQSPDSIHRLEWPPQYGANERSRRWWDELTNSDQREHASLNKLPIGPSELALFAIPKDYFCAMQHDLVRLHASGVGLLVACAGLSRSPGLIDASLKDVVLPVGEKSKQIEPSLDVANTSLNAAFSRWLVAKHAASLGETGLLDLLRKQYDALPGVPKRTPVRLTDEQVLDYIGQHFTPSPQPSATNLLRKLRRDGWSCEQHRFHSLYDQFQRDKMGIGDLFDGP